MSEGGPARAGATYASAGGSFLPWLRGGLGHLPVPRRMRAVAKLGEWDEDTRPQAAFERRRHVATQPREPLTPKGPAFWSKAVTTQSRTVRAQPVGLAFRGGTQPRMFYPDRCLCPWLRKAVYILVALGLILFFIVLSLISAYLSRANQVNFFMSVMAGQEQRLAEAVRNSAGGRQAYCVPCPKNWMQRAEACYLFTTEKMSWEDCVDNCIAQKGTLFIAETEGEMDSLRLETGRHFLVRDEHHMPARYWIGLVFNVTSYRWHWVGGAHLHIKMSTADDIPSVFKNICIQFHNGHKESKKCSLSNHCICKKKVN